MAKTTNIAWTNSTASPWFGCAEVSPGCANCYARELTEQKFAFVADPPGRSGVIREAYRKAGFEDWATRPVWGRNATRVLSKGFWKDVAKWDREADAAGKKFLLFPSLMDWLDDMPAGCVDQDGSNYEPAVVLGMLLQFVATTPHVTWQLLTKRPESFRDRLEAALPYAIVQPCRTLIQDWLGGRPPRNVWVGATIENRAAKARLDHLREIPAALRFVSFEPLLEAIDFDSSHELTGIHWGIVGGESGANRRDCGVGAIASLAETLDFADKLVFVKQDCHQLPGQQGRIPDVTWALKEVPSHE